MFHCDFCAKTFSRNDAVKRHMGYCKKREFSPTVFKCPQCEKPFSRCDAVNRHLKVQMCRPSLVGEKRSQVKSSLQASEPLPKKQRCELCDVDVTSLHNHAKSAIHKQNQKCQVYDERTVILSSAFKSRIVSYRLFSIDKLLTPEDFMEEVRQRVIDLIEKKILEVGSAVKVNLELSSLYCKWMKNGEGEAEEEVEETKSFNTCNKVIPIDVDNMNEIYSSFLEEILVKADDFQQKLSGWTICEVLYLEVNINKFSPLKGSSYIPLPNWIAIKKACVNVKNVDNACFAWAVVSGLYPADKHSDRPSSYPCYEKVLNLEGVSFPMTLSGIRRFEALNNISINVFEISGNNIAGPIHHTRSRRDRHLNLLVIEDGEKQHYCLIKNLSRLIRSQVSKHKGRIWLCDGCLLSFTKKDKYAEHIKRDCAHITTIIPSEGDNILKFKNYYNQLRAPVVVYADFEALLIPIESCPPSDSSSYTCNKQVHEPFSYGFYIKCDYNESLSKYVTYRGGDCVKHFIDSLEKELAPFVCDMKKVIPMHPLTPQQQIDFSSAIECHICGSALADDRVRDHCHLTGRFRGAAHSNCNLNYKIYKKIPIVMHNLSGYDSHFIIKALQKNDIVDLIPKNKENFISFTIKNLALEIDFRFLDSYRFMAASLDRLAKNLSQNQLYNTTSQFTPEKIGLLTRKGVFPYEYIDCWEKLQETSLPPKEAFYSALANCNISDDDYEHAHKVWDTFAVKTLGEYSDIYLKTDVLLLADVFENFRNVCLETYQLDPAHYYTAPGLSWDAMLRSTKIELELLTDMAMIKFISDGIRGGLSQCCGKYAVANNKYMNSYDSDKPSNYIIYLDANNLYGWAMSQYLPVGDFRWLSDEEIANFDISKMHSEDERGYFLEVDLEYPTSLHDLHNDLPFCPENKIPSIGGGKTRKLLATLEHKSNYIIHYANLQQAIRCGLILTRIHRILQFTQRPWLQPYIDLNTRHRTSAKNTFEKNFFKLMNNAVFGKTMENVDKRVDVRIATNWESRGKRLGARALISRLNFHSSAIIGDDIAIIQMNRNSVKYDKPIYVGFSVLELSKTLMYDFHYDYMQPKYGENLRLLYTDTDSFIYSIKTNDFYDDIKPDLADKFDTSDFDIDNIYSLPRVNKKVLGKMKDEVNGQIIERFIGVRSKCYYLEKTGGDTIKKIKGIKRNVVARDITGEDYYKCIMGGPVQYRKMCVIRTTQHTINTQTINKIVLKNYDDKRFPIPTSNIDQTLALGHKKIDKYYFI